MPIAPPAATVAPRFDPVYLTEDDLDDLASFTGMPREECLRRLRSYSPRELAEAWRRADPKMPEEILAFYATTDLYIWELMQWHASEARMPYWQILQEVTDRFPPHAGYQRVLDFGCGIGTDSLFLASRGYEVTLMDVDGPTLQFARHRFARRGMRASIIPVRSFLPVLQNVYDMILCFDVFEHLPDPLGTARRLVRAMRFGGVLVQKASSFRNDDYPHHLSGGVARFNGMRWHIALVGLGLRTDAGSAYRRVRGLPLYIQKFRYVLWKATGIWMVHIGKG
ncbi:MAG: class I SAM-dependent methyltransferase [Armatimonadota bacterium]|nr:class I SAM-dependent methyltransferase [Armatimonadota bacterium]